jgi:hypothetical protein
LVFSEAGPGEIRLPIVENGPVLAFDGEGIQQVADIDAPPPERIINASFFADEGYALAQKAQL